MASALLHLHFHSRVLIVQMASEVTPCEGLIYLLCPAEEWVPRFLPALGLHVLLHRPVCLSFPSDLLLCWSSTQLATRLATRLATGLDRVSEHHEICSWDGTLHATPTHMLHSLSCPANTLQLLHRIDDENPNTKITNDSGHDVLAQRPTHGSGPKPELDVHWP